MQSEDKHLSDQELLLAADGEVRPRRADEIEAHLAACWDCRARMAEIEGTIADFARAHRQTLDPQLPPIAGPRALLRAQLAELAAQLAVGSWRRFFQFTSVTRAAAYVCVTFVVAAVGGGFLFHHPTLRGANSAVASFERRA